MDLLTYLDDHFGGPKLAPTVRNLFTWLSNMKNFMLSFWEMVSMVLSLLALVAINGCEQEESKKQAAAELLQYADTFNKLGFTGLSMKSSTPDEIAAAVGTVDDFKCILASLLVVHTILFHNRLPFLQLRQLQVLDEKCRYCKRSDHFYFILIVSFGLCSPCIRFLGERSCKILQRRTVISGKFWTC